MKIRYVQLESQAFLMDLDFLAMTPAVDRSNVFVRSDEKSVSEFVMLSVRTPYESETKSGSAGRRKANGPIEYGHSTTLQARFFGFASA